MGGGGGASVNPIQTRGKIMPNTLLPAPLDSKNFLHLCLRFQSHHEKLEGPLLCQSRIWLGPDFLFKSILALVGGGCDPTDNPISVGPVSSWRHSRTETIERLFVCSSKHYSPRTSDYVCSQSDESNKRGV